MMALLESTMDTMIP